MVGTDVPSSMPRAAETKLRAIYELAPVGLLHRPSASSPLWHGDSITSAFRRLLVFATLRELCVFVMYKRSKTIREVEETHSR
jgi:hypothetical protein